MCFSIPVQCTCEDKMNAKVNRIIALLQSLISDIANIFTIFTARSRPSSVSSYLNPLGCFDTRWAQKEFTLISEIRRGHLPLKGYAYWRIIRRQPFAPRSTIPRGLYFAEAILGENISSDQFHYRYPPFRKRALSLRTTYETRACVNARGFTY